MAASCIYLVNDSRDVEADRAHPTRGSAHRRRVVPPWLAYTAGGGPRGGVARDLLPRLAQPGRGHRRVHRDAARLLFRSETQAVLDICIVSSAYLIRAIAGGAAAGIPLSQWFLLVMTFGSLFMVAGSAMRNCNWQNAPAPRSARSLESYTASYLRFVWTVAATAMVVCYSLWAFDATAPTPPGTRSRSFPSPSRFFATAPSTWTADWQRTRGDRAEGPGSAAAAAGVDRDHRCRNLLQLSASPPQRPTG